MLLTSPSEGAVALTAHEQGGLTEGLIATFTPEIFANDRMDRGGERRGLFNYRLRIDALVVQTFIIDAEQDFLEPQETDGR